MGSKVKQDKWLEKLHVALLVEFAIKSFSHLSPIESLLLLLTGVEIVVSSISLVEIFD